MNHTELNKILKDHRIGGFRQRTRRIFDTEWDETVSFEEMDTRVKTSVKGLKDLGLKQEKNGADCDSWTMWTISDVTKQWALEHAGEGSIPQIRVGRAHIPPRNGQPGHDVVIGVVDQKVYFWDYGRLTGYDSRIFDEVEFK